MKPSTTFDPSSDAPLLNLVLRAATAAFLPLIAAIGCGDRNPTSPETPFDTVELGSDLSAIAAYSAVLAFREVAINDPVGAIDGFVSSRDRKDALPELTDQEIEPPPSHADR